MEKEFVTHRELGEILGDLHRYLYEGAGQIGSLKALVEDANASVKALEKVVLVGNGQRSLISQISALQTQLESVLKKLNETTAVSAVEAEKEDSRFKVRWNVIATIASALLSAAALIIVAYLQK